MEKLRPLAKRVKRLRGSLTQAEFADRLKVAASRVSEWEAAKAKPTVEALYRLGSLAASIEDTIWFWKQAGLEDEKILAAARTIGVQAEGKRTFPIPKYRYTAKGREEAGPPVPLPKDYIPNPGATICVLVDKRATGVINSPRGLFIVDTSVGATRSPRELIHKVLMLSFVPIDRWDRHAVGVYFGRFMVSRDVHLLAGRIELTRFWHLGSLLDVETPFDILGLGMTRAPLALKLPPDLKEKPDLYSSIARYVEDDPDAARAFDQENERLEADFRFAPEHRVLGQVIGRLTGHLK